MEYYDAIAAGYDRLHAQEQLEKIEILLQHLPIRRRNVLDVGCGTGIAAAYFADIIGVDPALEMIKKAKMPVVCGKGEQLPFQKHVFDGVVCLTVVHHMQVPLALQEMQRVVKKDGWIAIGLLKKAQKFEDIAELIRAAFACKEVDAGKDVLFVRG